MHAIVHKHCASTYYSADLNYHFDDLFRFRFRFYVRFRVRFRFRKFPLARARVLGPRFARPESSNKSAAVKGGGGGGGGVQINLRLV